MSNEEQLEEILYKSHSLGIYEEVMNKAGEIRLNHPKLAQVDIYSQALSNLVNE